jgi:rhodanese-related sulfurtransferase
MKKKSKEPKKSFPVWGWIIAAVILIGVAILIIPGLSRSTERAMAKEISPSQASEMRDGGAFMLDVREPDEWIAGHIPGATLIPLGELSSRLSEVPKNRDVVVVCRSGNRSAEGRDILLNAGFEQVTSMGGGMNQWASAGLPVVTGH